jgi:enoyl-CoA hydratase/carnithine racemase
VWLVKLARSLHEATGRAISAGFNLAVSRVMILVSFSRRSRSFGVMRSSVGKTRGGGPTLLPHARGAQVAAEIFVMADDVTVEEAMNMLWRDGLKRALIERRRATVARTKPQGRSSFHLI